MDSVNETDADTKPVKERIVTVRLAPAAEGQDLVEKACRNGEWFSIPRGEAVKVPEGVANILQRAGIY